MICKQIVYEGWSSGQLGPVCRLERALRAISPGLADAPNRIEDDDLIERLLREVLIRSRALTARSAWRIPSQEGRGAIEGEGS